ncbi:hypothetical protein HQN86_19755 [Pedobacter panaciterrae]|jgi:hypothetical protein|uniref:hypothetical protein n=1 Tax=Pedobacter panaciterrae TaxID=363849 RepID=UPI00155D8CCB|nr:hypothetical protein [Pedobacter panaciterrae]NQX55867.1 hypothetical protein [Pedobacter panaciterrae]
MQHTFHIPVLGLGYSIDTPLKVARYGISSVVSIVDDELTERMRKYHADLNGEPYDFIAKDRPDSRSLRITEYLNLLHRLVNKQITELKKHDFESHSELNSYFELLPENSVLKSRFRLMQELPQGDEKQKLQNELKEGIIAGNIDVNIMSKVDKANYQNGAYLGDENTDALAALRGFAKSTLSSSVIVSAGLNQRLYAYMETFSDFFPNAEGLFTKQIILKVSDYRSAIIQAKVLAKKGLWVSEFRIESGLNCGGHAFATDGLLMGPILHEFKENRTELFAELFEIYQDVLKIKGIDHDENWKPQQRVTYQGGIGTAQEHQFLINYYNLDAAGWGSPFLLVPEATNVDKQTLDDIANASESDFYLSNASPLGVPFNNFRKSTAEIQRIERIAKGRPGSPCTKKYLCSNVEFTAEPICTASRQYQRLKIAQLKILNLQPEVLKKKLDLITEKTCLCEGLCSSNYLKSDVLRQKENKAVSICPGPNIAYFSRQYSLAEMIGHIYGRNNLLNDINRPNVFIKELGLYVEYLKKEMENFFSDLNLQLDDYSAQLQASNAKRTKYFAKFCNQLMEGVGYYHKMLGMSDLKCKLWDGDQVKKLDDIINKLVLLKI